MPYNLDVEGLEEEMMRHLSPQRYRHCFAVADYSMELAAIWGEDIATAFNAGLLHDMMHYLQPTEYLQWAAKYQLAYGPAEQQDPVLLHGPLAAAVLEQDWGCSNQQLLNAIRYHTIPRPQMDNVAKIVFLADVAEPGRPDYPGLEQIRALAKQDLDQAMVLALQSTKDYLQQQGKTLHPDTDMIIKQFRQIAEENNQGGSTCR